MEIYKKLLEVESFFLIAGPCVVENEKITLETAEFLKNKAIEQDIFLIFKASFKKANRTSLESFSGLGIEEGLRILQKVKEQFELPVITDVHETSEIEAAAQVADVIQIPAFLCRQTDLIVKAAGTGNIINLKKGQFLAAEDMKYAVQKAESVNNTKILLTERGTSFGYHNLVVDFRNFAKMKKPGYPVVFDVTHSLQQPSTGEITGGSPEFAPLMAKAALATGMVDGLFIETHPKPSAALSDSASMLPLSTIPQLLEDCLKLYGKK